MCCEATRPRGSHASGGWRLNTCICIHRVWLSMCSRHAIRPRGILFAVLFLEIYNMYISSGKYSHGNSFQIRWSE